MDRQERVNKAVIELGGEWPDRKTPPIPAGEYYTTSLTNELKASLGEWEGGDTICTYPEFMEARTRLENKPSWDDAPGWAEWLGNDYGVWTWFEVYPASGGDHDGEVEHVCSGHRFTDWRQSLERRPESKPDQETATALDSGRSPSTNNERRDHKEGEGVNHDWHGSMSGLPPVGETVEFCRHPDDPKSEWRKGEVIGYHDKWVWMIYHGLPNSWSIDTLGFRPIQSHRDKVIEAAHKVWNDNAHLPSDGVLAAMYDEGILKLPGDPQ